MNRSQLFTSFDANADSQVQAFPEPTTGFNRYEGTWTKETAAHLLRRTTFGANFEDINQIASLSMLEAVDLLFQDKALPNPPVAFSDRSGDTPGETWINNGPTNQEGSRRDSLLSWWFGLIVQDGLSIREQMVLFWHNHFVTEVSTVADARFSYLYSNHLRENALGNFKTLTEIMTIDGAMLRYLNGNRNTAKAPNENYARELFELFTIGKGSLAAPGDYTNYTEDDIQAAAKVLTGWRDDRQKIAVNYISNVHSKEDKVFSARFSNYRIKNAEQNEYKLLIEMIFEKEETARHICRKLYRWFVNYKIDESIEEKIINPMSALLITNNYDIKPALKALLQSEHFYDEYNRGVMIKSPIVFLAEAYRKFYISLLKNDVVQFHTQMYNYGVLLAALGDQIIGEPPGVAGWSAQYQEPAYYQLWLNSVTITQRTLFTDTLCSIGFQRNKVIFAQIDTLKVVAKIAKAEDPNLLVQELIDYMYPFDLTANQKAYLKTFLVDAGLPDYTWGGIWHTFLQNPNDKTNTSIVQVKLQKLFKAMLSMAEYQLS